MQRIFALVSWLVLAVALQARGGGDSPALPPDMAKILEQMQAGTLSPDEAGAALKDAGVKRQAALMADIAKGAGTIDVSDGTGKVEFPKWPDMDTFDKAYVHEDAIKQWKDALLKSIGSIGPLRGFSDKVGDWEKFDGAGDTYRSIIGKIFENVEPKASQIRNRWREENDRLWEEFRAASAEQSKRHQAVKNRTEQILAKQREEDKQLQIRYYRQEVSQARSAYAELYANWNALRQQIEDEGQDYYWVCTDWIRAVSATHYDENRDMNHVRATVIWGSMVTLSVCHPSTVILPVTWLPSGPLTQAELEKMILEPGAPPTGVPRSRIPSTQPHNDPLAPLAPPDPLAPLGPPDPLAPLGPPDPLAPMFPHPPAKGGRL